VLDARVRADGEQVPAPERTLDLPCHVDLGDGTFAVPKYGWHGAANGARAVTPGRRVEEALDPDKLGRVALPPVHVTRTVTR
jgi:hypothetical protein